MFQCINPSATTLWLDMANLCIDAITDGDDKPLLCTLHSLGRPQLGRMLEISLYSESKKEVSIQYHTMRDSSALQWLPPFQTSGQKYPYLFTQCQAIHA